MSGQAPSGPRWPSSLTALLLVAALIRILGLFGPGHSGDLFAFETWAEGVAKFGIGGYYANAGDSNYPPMLYLLWPLGTALSGGDLVLAIRALSIPFDLGLAALLFFFVRDLASGGSIIRERAGLFAAGLYVLNPSVVLTGTFWGQVDGMGALPMVGALVAVARGRLVAAGVLTVLAGLIKPQFGVAAFVLGGLALFWLRSPEGWRRAAILALSALIAFIVVLLPLNLGPASYLDLMRETFGRYPVHSGFAFNPWGMVFGFNHDDGPWFAVGTALELVAIGASLWLLRWRRDLVALLAVGSLIALTLYFVPTRAHERYLYGAIALLAPIAALKPRLRMPFYALSTTFYLTITYVLANSPYRILPGPKIDDFPGWLISLMCLVTTASGAWVAWRLVELMREPAADDAPDLGRAAGPARAAA
ncbi:MAG TPA: glycosyltransferase 87 family protein [Candidatus Limnocylindrales bacterium]|nr:glycosyltransferase 87 family protein [Candidatus Limnocylindrales bacterium]